MLILALSTLSGLHFVHIIATEKDLGIEGSSLDVSKKTKRNNHRFH